ncbi:hypothetical protein M569_12039 [Genlisea aurea]|uniref:Ion transport domain-containing protein n=1 Tax=Genlisea aurea TaxID=192259 RepID=S8C7I6_9LAMI|nr:hypothetical protein M569_12039 [Genlisea aurea]
MEDKEERLTSVSGTVSGQDGDPVVLGRFVVNPFDRRYRWWRTFLAVLVVYSSWSSPFELSFRKTSSAGSALVPIDLAVDFFFGIDIVLTFFVAYLDDSTYLLVDRHDRIAMRL